MKADLRAIGLIAAHGVRVSLRQRLLAGMALAALGFAWVALALREFHFGGGETAFVADLLVAALSAGALVVALGLTLGQVGGESGRRSATALLPKAVSHRAFVVGHWLGVMAGVAAFATLMAGVIGGVLLYTRDSGAGDGVAWATLLQVGFLQGVKGGIVAAVVVLLCGLVRSGALAGWLGVLVVMAGQLRGMLATLPERAQLAGAAGTRVIEFLVPDLALFDRGRALGAGLRIDWSDTAWLVAYAGLYAGGYLALAVHVFRRREA